MALPRPLLLSALLLLVALPAAAPPTAAHEVTCDAASCVPACLVHVPGGLNHACRFQGVELFQTWSCFPEGFHVEVLNVPVRRCGPPALP